MTENTPEVPDGWTGPREDVAPAEPRDLGGGVRLREVVHPDHELAILWNPDEAPVEVGVERVARDEFGDWTTAKHLESREYDSDEAALDDLPELCEQVVAEYAEE